MPPRTKRPLLGGLLVAPFICGILAIASPSSHSADILLVHRDTAQSDGWIASLVSFLQSDGHNVTDAQRADGPDTTDATNFDLVIVARETDSGAYDDGTEPQDWNALPIPIINMAPHVIRSSRWGWVDGTDVPQIGNHTSFDAPYPDTNHPFLAGLTAPETTIFATATIITAAQDALPAGAVSVATYNGGTSRGIFVIPAGTAMFNGKGTAGADRVGFLRGDEGSWDDVNGNGAQILRNMIAIYGAPPTDSDMDGMDDDFEQLIIDFYPTDAISTLADVLPGDNFDTDGLTNQQEHDRAPRTSPTNPDSDGDTINDGPEVNGTTNPFEGGAFDNSPPGDPTDPLKADSDGDTISDFDEIDASNGSVTNPNNPDTDGDTMPDNFEVDNMLDPRTDDAGLDPDTDELSNLEELNRGTLPQNDDTDGDDIKDGHEDGGGVFVDATMTGTDPLDPDTDGDGIDDGIESNSGVFVPANAATDTGTDPNNADTDGDKFRDNLEIDVFATDPTVAANKPPGISVLLVGADADPTFGADDDVFAFLQARYGSDNIFYKDDNDFDEGDDLGYSLLIISSTLNSGEIRGKSHNSPTPIVNWEQALADNNAGDYGFCDSVRTETDITQMNLVDHPITAGLPSPLTLTATAGPQFHNSPDAAVTVLGTSVDGAGAGNAMLQIADVGDPLLAGAGVTDDVAPARRVFLPINDGTFSSLTDDAKTLVGQAFDWAAGLSTATPEMRITDISYTRTSVPDNIVVDITFTSQEGKIYTIFYSDNFDAPLETRPDAGDDIPAAAGATTTTLTIDFNAESIPLGFQSLFFVVKENS